MAKGGNLLYSTPLYYHSSTIHFFVSMSSHIISSHLISFHLILLHIPSFPLSCHVMSCHLFSSFLISSPLLSMDLIWSPLISSHLISSHLISSHLISSHLISSHLISSLSSLLFSSLLFSSLLFSSLLFSSLLLFSHLTSIPLLSPPLVSFYVVLSDLFSFLFPFYSVLIHPVSSRQPVPVQSRPAPTTQVKFNSLQRSKFLWVVERSGPQFVVVYVAKFLKTRILKRDNGTLDYQRKKLIFSKKKCRR